MDKLAKSVIWMSNPEQVSEYEIGDDVIGRGIQGTVYGVQGHPDKVAKKIPTRIPQAHNHLVTNQFVFDKIASDAGFGPKIYEISYDRGRVMSISDPTTIPKYERGRRFVVVMEKLREIPKNELESHYLGIVNVWKKSYAKGVLNVDGFYGYSPFHQAVVTADFGGVLRSKNNIEFVENLEEYFDASRSAGTLGEETIARKYLAEFPNESFSQHILKPVLDKLAPP